MLFSAHITVLLTLLGSSALAANLGRNDYYPVRNQCSTQYGGYPVKVVPTSTSTVEITSTTTTTVTPTETVTGTGTTITTTLTATVPFTVTTSIPGATDTTTVLTTVSTTETGSIVTLTETATTTTTTTVATSTVVPTPAGFISAADTIPGDNLSQRKRDFTDASAVRRALDRASLDITLVAGGPPLVKFKSTQKVKRSCKQYPIEVVCTTTATSTVTATSTTTAGPVTVTEAGVPTTTTTTVTATAPVTVTEQGPSVTVTTTSTATSTAFTTPSVTETVTQTITQTSFTFASTAYAACATGTSNNLVYSAGNNSPINGVNTGAGLTVQQAAGASSTSQCCSLCFADPQCAYSAYLDGFACYLFRASSVAACNAPNAFSGSLIAVQSGEGGPGNILYGVSNGVCGQYNSVQSS